MPEYLVKRRTILEAGLKEASDETTIIPFDNLRVEVGNADPTKVVLLSKEEILILAQELQDTIGNLKYSQFYDKAQGGGADYAATLPSGAELQALYNGAGIVVEDSATGAQVTLQATTNPVADGDSVLFHDTASGLFEEGIFQSGV